MMLRGNNTELIRTPKRPRRSLGREGHSDRRRNLFDSAKESDEDATPLSPTSSEISSPLKSPRGGLVSLESNFNQMLLSKSPNTIGESPVSGKSPLVKGVRILNDDDNVGIPPNRFYSRELVQAVKDNPGNLYKAVHSLDCLKARVRLFVDDVAPIRKRGRSASHLDSAKRPKKKLKFDGPRLQENIKPIPVNKLMKIRRDKIKREKKRLLLDKKIGKPATEPKKKCMWEIFSSGGSMSRSFFSDSSVTMTPPSSTKKSSPLQNEITASPTTDDIVEEIKHDVLEMIEDDGEGIRVEVGNILEQLDKPQDLELSNLSDSSDRTLIADENSNAASLPSTPRSTPDSTKYFSIFGGSPRTGIPCSTPASGFAKRQRLSTPSGRGASQMLLDVGQKALREVQCHQCELVYIQGVPEDEKNHKSYHAMKLEMKYFGHKNERLVGIDGLSRIIMIRQGDPSYWWNKALEYSSVVNRDFGSTVDDVWPTQIYIYVREKRVIGFLSAIRLEKGFKLLPIGSDQPDLPQLCSEESYPVRCGVAKIWVSADFRKQGIATALMDALRRNFQIGAFLKLDDIAFSSPTGDGATFATAYFKKRDFLIYL